VKANIDLNDQVLDLVSAGFDLARSMTRIWSHASSRPIGACYALRRNTCDGMARRRRRPP
jgi:hypothetical protein